MTIWVSGLLVAAGGAVGAVTRFVISRWSSRRFPWILPVGTLFINWTGSFLLGLLYGSPLGDTWNLLLGTGFMGAYTTFSTFSLELLQLGRMKKWPMLYIYMGISVTVGILLALGGYRLGLIFNG
jgi:CrcB protein